MQIWNLPANAVAHFPKAARNFEIPTARFPTTAHSGLHRLATVLLLLREMQSTLHAAAICQQQPEEDQAGAVEP